MTDIAPLLAFLKVNGDLLALVVDGWSGEHITRRTQDEVHQCVRCPKRAQVAYVAETDKGERWLDLCAHCAYEARQAGGDYPVTDYFRCPIDGAPLRSATHQINADSTFVHIDGTTHGGFLDLVEADALRVTVQDAVRDWMAHADPANAGLIMSRDQVVETWCRENGKRKNELGMDDIMTIRALPQWINAG